MYPALWPDTVRLSDLGERFVCTVCGHRGADVWPLFESARMGIDASKEKRRSLNYRVFTATEVNVATVGPLKLFDARYSMKSWPLTSNTDAKTTTKAS
jgi:hypothetical protein